MKRNVLMFVGLFVLTLSLAGCRAGGQGLAQPGFGGQFQQPTLPNIQQTQQGLGQFGRNLGNRVSNGVINRGVNYAINQAISAF